MDDFDKNPLDYLKSKLNTKATLKQLVWKNAAQFFNGLRVQAQKVVEELRQSSQEADGVRIDFQSISDFEFHIYFGSDMVVYALQTNIVTFDGSHYLMKNKYLQQDKDRTFFGQVMIYDFMADSLRFNRTEDTGYLLGRILINNDGHFMIEGVRGLHYLFKEISKTKSSEKNHSLIIKKSLAVAIDSDLLAPDYSQVQFVTLGVRMKGDKELGHGKKIGFQMHEDDEIKPNS